MGSLNFKNKWVLVTGASAGLGKNIAIKLAKNEGANLILVARRKDRLDELKVFLETSFKVQIDVYPADLSDMQQVVELSSYCIVKDGFYGAVLNAGITYFGLNTAISDAQVDAIWKTNIQSVVSLCNRFGAYFEKTNKAGGVMIVASLAAKIPVPYQSVYSGSKGFLMNYANAFACELQNKDFSITVYLPGGIKTEMTSGQEFADLSKWLMPADVAADKAIKAFKNRKFTYVPGFTNQLGAFISNFLPRKFFIQQLAKNYKKSLEKTVS